MCLILLILYVRTIIKCLFYFRGNRRCFGEKVSTFRPCLVSFSVIPFFQRKNFRLVSKVFYFFFKLFLMFSHKNEVFVQCLITLNTPLDKFCDIYDCDEKVSRNPIRETLDYMCLHYNDS